MVFPWQYVTIPSDVINIQSNGSSFAPVIEVVGNPVIEWTFNDGTTSSSAILQRFMEVQPPDIII